jgi:hypothetical protein
MHHFRAFGFIVSSLIALVGSILCEITQSTGEQNENYFTRAPLARTSRFFSLPARGR